MRNNWQAVTARAVGFQSLIVASDGVNWQMSLRDAATNDAKIVRHADTCLVFNDPLPPHGLNDGR